MVGTPKSWWYAQFMAETPKLGVSAINLFLTYWNR